MARQGVCDACHKVVLTLLAHVFRSIIRPLVQIDTFLGREVSPAREMIILTRDDMAFLAKSLRITPGLSLRLILAATILGGVTGKVAMADDEIDCSGTLDRTLQQVVLLVDSLKRLSDKRV